jgi:hypothetical protein
VQVLNSIGQALFMSFNMFWEILWPLILGFTLSAIVRWVTHVADDEQTGA